METGEKPTIVTYTFRVGGMTCVNCQNRIEKKLKSTAGVAEAAVDFAAGTAVVTYNAAVITPNELTAAIETLGYTILDATERPPAIRIAGTLIIIFALYALLRQIGLGTLSSTFPLAEAGMNYGMLFVIGLVTSVHCVAMCGGINLSQTLKKKKEEKEEGGGFPPRSEAASGFSASPLSGGHPRNAPGPLSVLFPAILYNGGRVISYTLVGILAGALGSAVSVSGRFQGAVQIAAGVFMVIMGINMLGIFPSLRRFIPRLPKRFTKKFEAVQSSAASRKSPLIIGLLNGLMPCGPLQAMQLYALSTGSPIAGGVSMFLFCAGTVPLMFGLGALSSFLSNSRGRVFSARVMQAGAILVTVMGLSMFSYGWNLAGFNFNVVTPAAMRVTPNAGGPFEPVIENGVQIVKSTLSPGRYPAITVRQGIPVQWTINAPAGSINGCNNRMIIREYGIEYRFQNGDNVIKFTPERTGKFPYSCWMGMIRSSITVIAEGESVADVKEPSLEPKPAGVVIPTEKIALAEIAGNFQTIQTSLRDDGIDPAVIVVQRGLPVTWTIVNDSLDPGNSRLVFPVFYTRLDMDSGENTVRFLPTDDFDFSTGDNVFYGFVKVVDDINTVDINAIKKEVSEFETMMYPEAYFESQASGGCSCCGGAGA